MAKKYVCDSRNVLLVPPNKPYTYEVKELGNCVSIEFESANDICDFYSYRITDDARLKRILSEMIHIWNAKSSGYKLILSSAFYNLLHTVFILSNVDYSIKKKENLLEPAISYMQEHYGESNITNELLAEISDMSTVYFRKLFTKRYGLSPMKYISNIRIENAKNLLLGDDLSVSEIAKLIGFSSVYSFSRAFKKRNGLIPYRVCQGKQKLLTLNKKTCITHSMIQVFCL